MKKILLSGMQPTNQLHLGNYLGALKNWAKLQKEFECFFLVVDSHAITTAKKLENLKEDTYAVLATYIAGGVDPEQATLFVQSHVPEHAELAWVLTCHSTMGEMQRMTQFKDKSQSTKKGIPLGLFTYPALMAADILLYQTNLVPVGEDQKQHLELSRNLAERLNQRYQAQLFAIPEPYIQKLGGRVMDLQNPEKKMSKSDSGPKGAIYLSDSDSQILKKVKSAKTDSGSEVKDLESSTGVTNLIHIHAACSGKTPEEVLNSFRGKQYGQLKVETAEVVVEATRPIREETQRLLGDRAQLDALLSQGAQRAKERASRTLRKVYDQIGFLPQAH